MFSECTTHYTDPTPSVSAYNVSNWNVHSCSLSAVFHGCRASTFNIAFATEVSTAAVLQLFSMFLTSMSSVYVSLSYSNQGVYG